MKRFFPEWCEVSFQKKYKDCHPEKRFLSQLIEGNSRNELNSRNVLND